MERWTGTRCAALAAMVALASCSGSSGAPDVRTTPGARRTPNVPPTLAAIGPRTVVARSPLAFTVEGADVDGDALAYTAAPLPEGASFQPAARTFRWTPTAGQVGTSRITFTVSDGQAAASETVVITVLPAAAWWDDMVWDSDDWG